MKAVAEAQLKAKHRDAARNTVETAMEMIAPMPDADAEAYFPLAELGMIQAKAGDLAGAVRTADALNSSLSKIKVLGEVAAAHAREGRHEDARKSIRRALDAARHVPGDTLWNNSVLYFQAAPIAQGLDPMLPALQLLAPAQARADDLEGALKSVAEMGTSPGSRYNRNSTIGQIVAAQLASSTIGQIVAARLAVGDIAGARKAIEAIPDANAITTFIPAEPDSDRNDTIPDQLTGGRPPLLERVARQQAEQGDPAVVLDWVRKESKPNTKLRMLRGLADGSPRGPRPRPREPNPASPMHRTSREIDRRPVQKSGPFWPRSPPLGSRRWRTRCSTNVGSRLRRFRRSPLPWP